MPGHDQRVMSVTSVEVVGTQLHEGAAATAYLELQERPYALSDPVRIHGDMEAIGVPGAECAVRSGFTARRAEAIGIATRRARTAQRAWSPKAKEPGPP